MAESGGWLFIASMDVAPDKEALFNEVYDTEHLPMLAKVPGVISVRRAKREPGRLAIGGEERDMVAEGEPLYAAIYEIESPAVLLSAEWVAASEQGRWGDEVRPYTHNRRHVLRRVLG